MQELGEGFSRVRALVRPIADAAVRAFAWLSGGDLRAVLLLAVLALLTRLPLVLAPHATIADEFIYANFAIALVHGMPMFDIHPPLARMLFALVLAPMHNMHGFFPVGIGDDFGTFPFQVLRAFVAIFGITLPLLLYAIGRISGQNARWAFLVGALAVFDNALILYGATILPDTILLFANMVALFMAMLSARAVRGQRGYLYALLAGIMFGCALAIKWTALGMLPVYAVVLLWLEKAQWRRLVLMLATGVLVYTAVFCYYFTFFTPTSVAPEAFFPYFSAMEKVQAMRFPDPHSFSAILSFLPVMHHAMLAANTDKAVLAALSPVPSPAIWPLGHSTLIFWYDRHNPARAIYLTGNILSWIALFALFIFGFMSLFRAQVRREILASREGRLAMTFILGYLTNYLPFFFLHRPTYLYHYFTALAFLFLLAPYLVKRAMLAMEVRLGDRMFPRVFFIALLVGILMSFAIIAPITYGW